MQWLSQLKDIRGEWDRIRGEIMFIVFALKWVFFFKFYFIRQCFIFFEHSYSQNVQIRIIKRLVVKLGHKQGDKPAIEIRLGFRFGFGQGDPR